MNNLFLLVSFLLINGIFFGCTPTQMEFFVPAVIKPEKSELVKITLSINEGKGKVYTSIDPVIGLSTQHSTKKAINYASFFTLKNLSNCDIFIDFLNVDNSSLIDGPSASLAIALATASALKNLSYPSNAIVTGEIFENGVVGPVGGIIDKIQVSIKNNKTLFISPKLQLYEKILISNFFSNSTIKIVEIENFSQGYAILFLNQTINPKEEIGVVSIPENLKEKKVSEKEKLFLELANKINNELEKISLSTHSNQKIASYLNYFKRKAELNKILINKGYYYTAANNAFLDLMDAKLLEKISSDTDLDKEFESLEKCVNKVEKINPEIYQENFELLAGGQARYMWAKNKLSKLKTIQISSLEDKYLILREIYSAQTWCFSSLYLLEKADSIKKEKKLNYDQLNFYLQEKIESLDLILQNSSFLNLEDSRNHLLYAKKLLEEKKIAGAFFDVAYASFLLKFESDKINLNEKEIFQKIEELSNKNFSTLWANLYQGQGIYLLQSSSSPLSQYLTIYSVLLLAAEEEQFLSKVNDFSKPFSSIESEEKNGENKIKKSQTSRDDFIISLVVILSLFILTQNFLSQKS